MRFCLQHTIPAAPEAVEEALLDRATLELLTDVSPVVWRAQPVFRHDRRRTIERLTRCEARGLRALTGARLAPDRAEWKERILWRRAAHVGFFAIDPTLAPWLRSRFRCEGRYHLVAQGAVTRRVVEGEVSVAVPVVGAVIEKIVVELLERHFAAEAQLLATLTCLKPLAPVKPPRVVERS
jgi:hypothetical protein